MFEKYKDAYYYLYEDQLEGAEEDYLEEFQAQFDPAHFAWDDLEKAKDALHCLLNELVEDRSDFDELIDSAGLDSSDLVDIGFVV